MQKKIQKNIVLIDVILCLNQTVNQSCQDPSSEFTKANKIEKNDVDEDGETDQKKIPDSTCIQSYSTYKLDDLEPFLIPSGCKCHEVKNLS